jgi:hypothetical protein
MRPNLSRNTRVPSRAGTFRCNLCQEPFATDQALRQHYQQSHPEAAAEIERALARLTGQTADTH